MLYKFDKNYKLNFRLSEEDYNFLQILADDFNISIAEVLRGIISRERRLYDKQTDINN